jgi:hypothetical protein
MIEGMHLIVNRSRATPIFECRPISPNFESQEYDFLSIYCT